MSTTAQPLLNLDRSVPDIMDLNSDAGLDFGDGDIELDMDTLPTEHPHDDEVPIKDAGSLAGLDARPGNDDHDNFMDDHDQMIVITTQEYASLTATATDGPALPNDDLLEYSDDEGEGVQLAGQSYPDGVGETTHTDTGEDHQDAHQEGPYDEAEEADSNESDAESESSNDIESQPGGVLLRIPKSSAAVLDGEHSDQSVSPVEYDGDEEEKDDARQDRYAGLGPITVNYAGNELWLFKQHDTDESGDWLLEDSSLAATPMSNFFQACRSSLGDDISSEHEIGIRFDNLHHLEIYEDNTACVACSLQRMVQLYHTLQQQDGNDEPDSFYCSLLFRPRFVTLLSDIAKYADQGSGFSGLNAAIGAGETHFNHAVSNASTDNENTDWDEEEHEEGGVEDGDDSEQEANEEHEEQPIYSEHDQEADEGQNPGATHSGLDIQYDLAVTHRQDEEAIETQTQQELKEDDLLEYSDDEGHEEMKNTAAKEVSPSSSTVQGDETANAGNVKITTGKFDHDFMNSSLDDGNYNLGDDDNRFDDQLLDDVDGIGQGYQAYDGSFEQNENYQDIQAYDATGQDFTGFEYQDLNTELQPDFLDGTEFQDTDAIAKASDFADTDNFLVLNETSEWTADPDVNVRPDESTGQDDVEDGTDKHGATATSSTADSATVSAEMQTTSSQGQKRSIDEAEDGTDAALDSIDAKRARV